MEPTPHLTAEELQEGLDHICHSPQDRGSLELIVRRPHVDARETLTEATLDLVHGLVGDTWISRTSSRTSDGSPHPELQLTLMNSRVISLLARSKERWPLAGDQLFVDFDLSANHLPPGTRLQVGSTVLEISTQPHTGCQKFEARFGREALLFVNAPARREMRLRGINARVIKPGTIRLGDAVAKFS